MGAVNTVPCMTLFTTDILYKRAVICTSFKLLPFPQ